MCICRISDEGGRDASACLSGEFCPEVGHRMALENNQEYVEKCEDYKSNYNEPNDNELISSDAYPRKENCDTRLCESARYSVEDLITPPQLDTISILRPIYAGIVPLNP